MSTGHRQGHMGHRGHMGAGTRVQAHRQGHRQGHRV